MYDHETSGCNDGLESYGLNRNQAAESTLAYLISNTSLPNAFDLESKNRKEIVDKMSRLTSFSGKTTRKIPKRRQDKSLLSTH